MSVRERKEIMVKIIGGLLLAAGVTFFGGRIWDKLKARQKKAARIRRRRQYRKRFVENQREIDAYWKGKTKKGKTIFHSPECAEFCGGVYVPKGAELCLS